MEDQALKAWKSTSRAYEILTGMNHASKKFWENIQQSNNALAMTLIGVKHDYAINQQGRGLWLFKI